MLSVTCATLSKLSSVISLVAIVEFCAFVGEVVKISFSLAPAHITTFPVVKVGLVASVIFTDTSRSVSLSPPSPVESLALIVKVYSLAVVKLLVGDTPNEDESVLANDIPNNEASVPAKLAA